MITVPYSSPFIPAEWIAAHGLRPHWLCPGIAPIQSSIAVTRGICPYAGAIINAALSGIDASALVLTTICDQMRYAAAVIESRSDCPIFLFNVPSTWQTAEARNLYTDELKRFGRFLVQLGGKSPDNTALSEMMLAYDCARLKVIAARDKVSARRFAVAIAKLRDPLPEVSSLDAEAITNGIPLAIIGGPMLESDFAFYDLVEQSGGRIALDGTEGGCRTMPRPFDPANVSADPLQELADAYFDHIPDAFRRPNSGLYEWLDSELSAQQVRGIIFRRYVWCDLWHAELQRLKQWSPVPVLEIDLDSEDLGAPNRVQGRIEAFLEMLR
jgi:benzoyl-CoA reductase/2-hydroxyglutaryl-CoA dehydratase subunit BcrC/BadD/HgdB